MSVDVLDLTCPKCSGTMEADRKNGTLHCPFCGYEQLLVPDESDSIEEKAYARQRGVLKANEDAEKERKRRQMKIRLIIIGVIVSFFLIIFALGFIVNLLQPKVNPFDYITVEFSGKTGYGSAEIVYKDVPDSEIDIHEIRFSISPDSYLSEGDRVTVTATSSTYALSPTSKTYTAEGFDTYLKDLSALSEKAVTMIHNKSDILIDKTIGNGYVKATSVKPYIMYLTTDGKTNMLYDVYRVVYPEKDGAECERFAVVYYKNVIVHDTDEPSMNYEGTMYCGQIIEVLNKSYAGYLTGYKALKDVRADIMSHQSSAVTLQEREAAE